MDPRAESLSLCRFYHSFFRGRGPQKRGERQRACADGMPMPVKHSERGCPTRTQPLPQLPGWPCKTNSNATPRRRAQLPCTELFECQHHRVLWPIVDVAPGDCSFLLGCCDSSLRLRLLRCNAVASCPDMNNTRAGLLAWRSTPQAAQKSALPRATAPVDVPLASDDSHLAPSTPVSSRWAELCEVSTGPPPWDSSMANRNWPSCF